MKTKSETSGYIIRSAAAAAFFLFVIVALSSAFNPNKAPKSAAPNSLLRQSPEAQARTLTFADRVAYQRAIEEVYWRHRIWPKERLDPKPSLDEIMPSAQLEKKVEDYLRNSEALEDYWQHPLSAEQLQAEMERMASHTRQPEVLREIFEALGNDPFVIAECLARPALSERLVTTLYAHDQRFHGDLKRRAAADLATHGSVKEMKQTSGTYSETEWIKNDDSRTKKAKPTGVVATPLRGVGLTVSQTRGYSQPEDAPNAVKLNSAEWKANVEKLADNFGVRSRPRGIAAFEYADMSAHSKDTDSSQAIPVGLLSRSQEEDAGYYATVVLNKGKGRLKVATIAWLKEPLKSWLNKAENQVQTTMAAVTDGYTLPEIPDTCTDDTWTATSTTNAPDGRAQHTAVWTGSEMIVWGGFAGPTFFNTGGRYNPTTDTWTATSTTNAPSSRYIHTAVWTGSEMIVWGGYDNSTFFNTGGRYNPTTDTWTATSTTNAPSGRQGHTAVWTGSEMLVWGGLNPSTYENTGGRYNPITDTWIATSPTNAPSGRYNHTAVWTGSEMIVWGELVAPSMLTPAGDTIPSRTRGQPPALPTRPLPDTYTRQCGPAVK
jgi:hypothetical protein